MVADFQGEAASQEASQGEAVRAADSLEVGEASSAAVARAEAPLVALAIRAVAHMVEATSSRECCSVACFLEGAAVLLLKGMATGGTTKAREAAQVA